MRVKRNTAAETDRVRQQVHGILATIRRKRFDHVNDFVSSLADLRRSRGEAIALRDLRYSDSALVDALEKEIVEQADRLAHRCVQFLLQPAALQPYEQRVRDDAAKIDALERVADARQLEADVTASAGELEMLIDIVSNLKIDDATHRITIIDNISAIFAQVNTARAALKRKTKELLSVEGVAEFNSQLRLLNQSVVNFLDVSDSPEKCDEFLTKLMVQIEELEGRFAEFDEFVVQLTEKREEVYNAFDSRKVQLVEARNQRTAALQNAAERILKGIKSRVETLSSINDIHGYFASDLMIEKVRGLVAQLQELGDTVKADDIQSRLKTVREDAVRQFKDRQELFVEGEMVIRLGQHRFSVNAQPLDLTTVFRDGQMLLHLTGTNFFQPIEDETLLATREVWDQQIVSENREVYRAEYLAFQFLGELYRPVAEGTRAGSRFRRSRRTARRRSARKRPPPLWLRPDRERPAGLRRPAADRAPPTLHGAPLRRSLLQGRPRSRCGDPVAGPAGDEDHDRPAAIPDACPRDGPRVLAAVWRPGRQATDGRHAARLRDRRAAVPQRHRPGPIRGRPAHDAGGLRGPDGTVPGLPGRRSGRIPVLRADRRRPGKPPSPSGRGQGEGRQEAFIVSRRAADLAAAFQRHLQQHNFAETFAASVDAVETDPRGSRAAVARLDRSVPGTAAGNAARRLGVRGRSGRLPAGRPTGAGAHRRRSGDAGAVGTGWHLTR